ncbi:MAG: hypothetical protein ACP5OB_03465 [Candidatus Ratteibacteria bacterium]
MEKDIENKILNILKKLIEENIDFYIVGGMALVLYGIPRTTLDIDIIIPGDKEIIYKIFEIFEKENFKTEQKDILSVNTVALIEGQWITFEDEKGREIFDILIEKKEKFEKVKKEVKKIKFGQNFLPVAPLKVIKEMKKETKRDIDIYDIELIEKFEKENPDLTI